MAEGLDAEQKERAFEVGHVDAEPGYTSLLDQAGFESAKVRDVTSTYLGTLSSWYDAWNDEAVALKALIGSEDFGERQSRRSRSLRSVRDGLVRRYLVTGLRPESHPS